MGDIKDLNSTAVYAWTTLISVIICVPAALIMEGPRLKPAVDALAGAHPNFYFDLFIVGLLYHLYNQVGSSRSYASWLVLSQPGGRQLCAVAAGRRRPPLAGAIHRAIPCMRD